MNNLKKLREENNLSIKELANLLKVTKGKYTSWENDNEDVPSKYLFSLSYLYGVGYDELLAYEVPDDLPYSLRKEAVRKKYTKHVTRVWIALTALVVFLAVISIIIVNLVPQIHAKYHTNQVYSKMINYLHEEVPDASILDVVAYANVQSGIEEELYAIDVCIITYDRQYMLFYSYENIRYMLDIPEGHYVMAHGNIHEGEKDAYFEVVTYSVYNFIVIYENPDEIPFKDVIDCYKASLTKYENQ